MRFPRARFVDENTAFEQTIRIHDEIYEVCEELTKVNIDYHKTAIEAWDVIHVVETLLRILAENHGVNLDKTKLAVEEKNRLRGYYGDDKPHWRLFEQNERPEAGP